MAIGTLNPEGLTFEEWVCAAGVAQYGGITHGDIGAGVYPYSYSYQVCKWVPRGKPPARRSITYYPKTIRTAWRNGEDPTEWRALPQRRRGFTPKTEHELRVRGMHKSFS